MQRHHHTHITCEMVSESSRVLARDELKSSGETLIPDDDLQAIRQYLKLEPR